MLSGIVFISLGKRGLVALQYVGLYSARAVRTYSCLFTLHLGVTEGLHVCHVM